jgi:hypoxanthine phosphoribosyltransferase
MAQMYDAFLSYSHLDSSIAQELHADLTAAKLSCFMAEKDISIADRWEGQIRAALRASHQTLLLITPRSCNSTWVLLESGACWVLDKKVVPLLMFVSPEQLPDTIRSYQAKVIETKAQRQQLVAELAAQQPRGAHRGLNVRPDRITFQDVLAELQVFLLRISQQRWTPDLIVGSGRGGIIAAAIIATNLGHKPLRMLDVQFEWRGSKRITTIAGSSLQKSDVYGKKVLVVESTRQAGDTFKLIEAELLAYGPGEIRSFATVWRTGSPSTPDYYAFHLDAIPSEPWDLGFLYSPHDHLIGE